MKITGGSKKGVTISPKVLKKVRPTASKVREAVFNILGDRIQGATVLDLYAGTGIIGFEALSRGAERCTFADISASMVKGIIANPLFTCNKKNSIFHGNALDILKVLSSEGKCFDVIYVDPPYNSPEIARILPILGEGTLLEEGGCVFFEHFHKISIIDEVGKIFLRKTYRYGDTVISLFNKK